MRRFKWACEHAEELGAIPDKIAVGGDSAGGNLATVVSQLARDENPQGPQPVLQWLLYPRTDFTAQTRSLTLFADGFLLTKADIDWFDRAVPRRLRRSTLRIRGCRRCSPIRWRGCRPR